MGLAFVDAGGENQIRIRPQISVAKQRSTVKKLGLLFMTKREFLYFKKVRSEFDPTEIEEGVSILLPEKLAYSFQEFLTAHGISAQISGPVISGVIDDFEVSIESGLTDLDLIIDQFVGDLISQARK